MPAMSLRLVDFSGGLNLAAPVTLLAPNQSPNLKNVIFDEVGALMKRPGYTRLNENPIEAKPITGLYRYYKVNGSSQWLAVCGTNLVSISDIGTVTNLSTDFDDGDDVFFTSFKDSAFCGISSAGVMKYDGTTAAVVSGSPRCKYIVTHHEKLMCAGISDNLSRVAWCEEGDETSWPVNNYIDFDDDDGDVITGMASFAGNLYVFKNNSIYGLYGTTNADFYTHKLQDGIGCVAPKSIVAVENGIYFCGRDGLKFFDGASVTHVSRFVDPLIQQAAPLRYIAGGRYQKYLLWSFRSLGSSANDRMVVLDMSTGAWTYFEGICASVFASADGANDNGELFFGSSKTGLVYEANKGTSDDGNPIDFYYSTPYFDLGAPEYVKQFRKLVITALANGASVTIDYEVDRGAYSGSLDVSATTGTTWGKFTWGQANWTAARPRIVERSLPQRIKGHYIRFIFRNSDSMAPAKIESLVCTVRLVRAA